MKVIVAAAVTCALTACLPRDYELDTSSFTSEDLRMVEQKVGIALPADARGLNMYHARGSFDPWFMARIELPAASISAMTQEVERLPNQNKSTSPFPDRLTRKVTWWHPPAGALERRFMTKDGDLVEVVLADEGERTILYVIYAPVG